MKQIDPEIQKSKPTSSPLDDVHTAPYAAYAQRILDEQIMSDDAESPLADVIGRGEEQLGPEPGSEEWAEMELERFSDEIENIRQYAGVMFSPPYTIFSPPSQGFYVAFDDVERQYVIKSRAGEGTTLSIVPILGQQLPDPIALPSCLRISDLYVSGCPIKSVPSKLDKYWVIGSKFLEIPMPDSASRVELANTSVVTIKQLPPDLTSLWLSSNNMLETLPALPDIEELHFEDNGPNGSLRYSLDELPASLKRFTTTDENLYNRSEKRKMKKRGIFFEITEDKYQ